MTTAHRSAASVGEFLRRADFTNGVIDDFAKENNIAGSPALNTLAEFINERVLVPEGEWNANPAKTEEGLPAAREAIIGSLSAINEIVPIDKIEQEDVRSIGEGVFLAVIKYSHNCPFPLYFC
ncbi:hypothetical protein DEJ44_09925 [Streptomyces venezuelae]|uniref:hypothetical protein n=1 Tax=Streptomyces venezuelae TaxID=54571 RepID=UPI0012394812|nr:hypothetical protein [Streptomyces venezuelae]QES05903.1 hypothetical protein DEJ44_09925 [Streptomyces venezuelae]